MNDTSVAAAFLSGLEAGRFQGYQDGRNHGFRDGYDEGHLAGMRKGWAACDAHAAARYDELRAIYGHPTPGESFTERRRRQRERELKLAKPLKTPAECLATWETA